MSTVYIWIWNHIPKLLPKINKSYQLTYAGTGWAGSAKSYCVGPLGPNNAVTWKGNYYIILTLLGFIQPSKKCHGLHSPQDWISDLEILFPQTQRERWPGESIRLHVPSKYNLRGLQALRAQSSPNQVDNMPVSDKHFVVTYILI